MKIKTKLFLLLLAIFFPAKVFAVESAKPMAEKLVQEFETTKLKIMKDEVRQREVLGALYDINKKMKKIVSEKGELEQEKMLVESNVRELASKITELAGKTKTQKSLLRARLSAIYKLGGQGVARIVFSSASSSELERNLKILGIVAKQDLDLIKNYSKSVKELESRKRKLQMRWARLKEVEQNIQGKEKNLTAENESKNKLLDQVRRAQETKLTKLTQIRKRSREISAQDDSGLLDLLFEPSFFEAKGLLPKPVEGPLVQGYGLIKDDVHNVVISHKGQFYSVPLGSPIKSIFNGKVAYAGPVPGFGMTLILDHGDHYYSVYSHAKNFDVHQGDEVKQSQTVAFSGRSGTGYGDGLYFEIRHFSEPADPKNWMKGNSL